MSSSEVEKYFNFEGSHWFNSSTIFQSVDETFNDATL